MTRMPTPFESAQLNLQLFELRREPTLREARQWFLQEFHPASLDELATQVGGPRNAAFRMVIGYWEMAASLVTFGAIDRDMFLAAHGEIVAAFAKVQPFLGPIRVDTPDFCRHMETVLMAVPGMAETLDARRTQLRAFYEQGTSPPDGVR